MKKFRLIALFLCVLAVGSAFITPKESASFGGYYGWAWYPSTGRFCNYYSTDWGFYCDKTAYGEMCTIGGGGYIAYASEVGCEHSISTEILYRVE